MMGIIKNASKKIYFIFGSFILMAIIALAAGTEINDVGTTELSGLITIGNLVTGFVNSTHILDRTITADDIADSSINNTHLTGIGLGNSTLGSGIITLLGSSASPDFQGANVTFATDDLSRSDILIFEYVINHHGGTNINIRLNIVNGTDQISLIDNPTDVPGGSVQTGTVKLMQSPKSNASEIAAEWVMVQGAVMDENAFLSADAPGLTSFNETWSLGIEASFNSASETNEEDLRWILYRHQG